MTGYCVSDIAKIVSGTLHGDGSASVSSVVIDSRKTEPGGMFAALPGERADGHDYIQKALDMGAACCLAQRVPEGVKGPVITVPDVAAALKILAEAYRKTLCLPVIGIAGSVGKTTTKEMVASVLSQRYKVLKTEKNLNNELGVPLTIFRIEPEHEAAVVEMGISDFGEMTRLAEMVRPTMAVYTVIGHAHLEKLRDRSGVLRAKTELLPLMPPDGTVFLNGDDDMLSNLSCAQKKVLYGMGDNSGVRAENVFADGAVTRCDVVCGCRRIPVTIPAYGRHMISAALAGAAVGIDMGLSDDDIAAGISAYEIVGRRASVFDTGYLTLVDDCYNANPDSVKCGVDSLKRLPGRKVCILGDMLELGDNEKALHREVGEYAAENGVSLLMTAGELSANTAQGANKANTVSVHFDTAADLVAALPKYLRQGDTVLVKASHSMKFEDVSEAIKKLR